MEEQVEAFREESDALQALLAAEPSLDFSVPTQFKDWSAEDILRHLHCQPRRGAILDGDEAFAASLPASRSRRAIGASAALKPRAPATCAAVHCLIAGSRRRTRWPMRLPTSIRSGV